MKFQQESLFFRNSQDAFNDAIAKRKLNEDPDSSKYAGDYMYMQSDAKGDYFKNINTRKYMIVT